ncbi:MAG TPA: 2-methylcitrate dehydratase, partial [Bacteroidia bacterium]|nr:2-methylcitrate dehydratase [Bacteroidia bacterium]
EKRSIANALTVELNDGTKLEEIVVEYPIGHKRRRDEGIPELIKKYKINLARKFPEKQQQRVLDASLDYQKLSKLPVNEFVDLMVI